MKVRSLLPAAVHLGALAALATPALAAPQFDEIEAQHRSFGMITWPWVVEVGEGASFARHTWLAEDGGRIRFRKGVDGPWVQSEHQPDGGFPALRRHDGIYRDLEIIKPFPDLDQWCGLAVGEKGQWSWWMGDLLQPSVEDVKWNDLAPVALPSFDETLATATVHEIFEVDIVLDQAGTTGPRFWVVGTDHLLGYCTSLFNPAASFVKPALTPYPNDAGGVSTLRTISFAPDGLHGIAAGDTVAYYTTDGGETWSPSTVNGAAEFSSGESPTIELWSSVLDRQLASGKWEGFLVGGVNVQGAQYLLRTKNGGMSFGVEHQRCEAPGQTSCASLEPCQSPPFDSCTGSAWALGNGAPLSPTGTSSTTTLYTVHRLPNGDTVAGGYLNQTLLRPAGNAGNFGWEDVTGFCAEDIDQTTLWGLHGAPGSDYLLGVGAWGAIKSSLDSGVTWQSENTARRWRFDAIDIVRGAGQESTVYLAGQNLRVARSDNSGRDWHAENERGLISQATVDQLDFGSTMEDVAVFGAGTVDPGDDIVVAVGFRSTVDGQTPYVLRSSSGGDDCYEAVDLSAIVPGSALTAVEFNQDATSTSDLRFFATTSRGEVLRSSDLGATWSMAAHFGGRLTCLAVPNRDMALVGGRYPGGQGSVRLISGLAAPTLTGSLKAVDLLDSMAGASAINDVVTNGRQAFACGSGGELWDLGRLPRLERTDPATTARVVVGSTPLGPTVDLSLTPKPTLLDLQVDAPFLVGRELLSLGLAPGRGSVQLLVGSTGGRLCMVAGQRGSYSKKRVHSGVSNDIEDIEFRSRATGSSDGRAFIVSQSDRERVAQSVAAAAFGPVSQPTLLEVVFALSELP